MGRDTAADATSALRLLNSEELRHCPRTGPAERTAHASTPGTPLNLGILDYITQARQDVVDHVRAVVPDPKPIPAQVEGLYDWYVEQTGDADEAQQAQRDTLLERHRLEHAIALGEYDTVCKEPCPRCGCWGLMWDTGARRALCSNRRCRTPGGMSSTWPLTRLAAQRIQRTEIWRRNAT